MSEVLSPDLEFDLASRTLVRDGRRFKLTSKEAEVFRYLRARRGETVTREQLEQDVWQMAPNAQSATASVTVRRLRAKLERDTSQPRYLHTLVGVGWRLELPSMVQAPPTLRYRSSELARPDLLEPIQRALERKSRLLTLVGAPGVGKTRLAHVILRLWKGETECVELASLPPGITLGAQLRHHLGLAADSDLELVFGTRTRPLLLLDGAESCVDRVVAWLVDESIPATILITSREAMGVPEEWVLQVPPLTPDEANTLIALRTGNSVEPYQELLKSVRTPLELELCLASGVDPAAIVEGLERGKLPTGLERVLGWSWEQLGPDLRELLLVAASLDGPLHPVVAERVTGRGVAADLSDLHRKHWLHQHELLPFVRAFLRSRPGFEAVATEVGECLSALAGELLKRHDTHYLEVLEDVRALMPDLERLALGSDLRLRIQPALLLVATMNWCWTESRFDGFFEELLREEWEHPWRAFLEAKWANLRRRRGGRSQAVAMAKRIREPLPGDPHEAEWLRLQAYLTPLDEGRVAWIGAVLETREPQIGGEFLRGVWLEWQQHQGIDVAPLVHDAEHALRKRGLSRRVLQYTKLFLGLDQPGAEQLLEESEQLGLHTLSLALRHRLGVNDVAHHPERARQRFETLLELRRERGDRSGLQNCLGVCGTLAYGASDLEVALMHFEELARYTDPGSPAGVHLEGYLWAVRTGLGQVTTPYDRGWTRAEVSKRLVRGPGADVMPLVRMLEAESAGAVLRDDPSNTTARATLDQAIAGAADTTPDRIEFWCLLRRVRGLRDQGASSSASTRTSVGSSS